MKLYLAFSSIKMYYFCSQNAGYCMPYQLHSCCAKYYTLAFEYYGISLQNSVNFAPLYIKHLLLLLTCARLKCYLWIFRVFETWNGSTGSLNEQYFHIQNGFFYQKKGKISIWFKSYFLKVHFDQLVTLSQKFLILI